VAPDHATGVPMRRRGLRAGATALAGRIGRVRRLLGPPRELIAVLGMHRSGTSAVVGSIAERGLRVGEVTYEGGDNARGTQELDEIVALHDEILARAGCSWQDPPAGPLPVTANDRRRRDRALGALRPGPGVVKDPRMLIVPELWADLEMLELGVFREPGAVIASLRRRSEPPTAERCAELWCTYNEALIARHDRKSFPVLCFDRPEELDREIDAALRQLGVDAGPGPSGGFLDPGIVRSVARPLPEMSSELRARVDDVWSRLESIGGSRRERPARGV
jgi:hypothetical protein